jgi:hypothetical protein
MDNSYEIVDHMSYKFDTKANYRARSNQILESTTIRSNNSMANTSPFIREIDKNNNNFKTPKSSYSLQNNQKNANSVKNNSLSEFDLANIAKNLDKKYFLTPSKSRNSKDFEMRLINVENMYHNTDLVTFSYIKKVRLKNNFFIYLTHFKYLN